jgi:hypothetical protein
MSSARKKITSAAVITLIAGVGLTGVAGSASATNAGSCTGQSAPENTNVLNQAPVATDDTVSVVSGMVRTIKVLANDTDADGDKLYLESTSSPRRAIVCALSNGTVQLLAPASKTDYTTTFTYGVTDGDRYRTGTVTLNVDALHSLRPVLDQKLVLGKHGKVKQRARYSITNPNKIRLMFLAGNPKKDRPAVQRYVYPGKTYSFTTKDKRIAFVGILAPKAGNYFTFVNTGALNTRNGNRANHYIGETYGEDPVTQGDDGFGVSSGRAWARRAR